MRTSPFPPRPLKRLGFAPVRQEVSWNALTLSSLPAAPARTFLSPTTWGPDTPLLSREFYPEEETPLEEIIPSSTATKAKALNSIDKNGLTAVHRAFFKYLKEYDETAAALKLIRTLRKLKSNGADLNKPNARGLTLAHLIALANASIPTCQIQGLGINPQIPCPLGKNARAIRAHFDRIFNEWLRNNPELDAGCQVARREYLLEFLSSES